MVVNGGLMPIQPATVQKVTGETASHYLTPGNPLPASKSILLERDDIRLWFLTDVFVPPAPSGAKRAVSVGDILISAGVAFALGELAVRHLRFSRQVCQRPQVRLEGRLRRRGRNWSTK